MEVGKNIIGKVGAYNQDKGVGKIVTDNNTYLFLVDDLIDKDIKRGDFVKFRAEKVRDEYRAFFVSRYDINKFIGTETSKTKIYKNE
jgi:hypothetical protein